MLQSKEACKKVSMILTGSVCNLCGVYSCLSGSTAEYLALKRAKEFFFCLIYFVIQQAHARSINVTLPLIPKIELQQT